MKKIIKNVDKKKGIIQITTIDERWYARMIPNAKTGLPDRFEFKPSTTWVCSYYPKGIAFYKWLAAKGWDEAEAIKNDAGDKGTKVHKATEIIDAGEKVLIDSKIKNPHTEKEEEISLEEYWCVMTYIEWLKEIQPKLIASEFNVYSDLCGGTVDRLFLIGEDVFLVDLKTSQYIWMSHILQISQYKDALRNDKEIIKKLKALGKTVDDVKLATLQIGFRRNKKGYFFKEHPNKFKLFKNVYEIWKDENGEKSPAQKDYPLFLENKIEIATKIEPKNDPVGPPDKKK